MRNYDDLQYPGDFFDDLYAQPPYSPVPQQPAPTYPTMPPDWDWQQAAADEADNPFPTTGGGGTGAGGIGVGPGMSEADGRAYDAAHGLIGGYMTATGWVSGSPHGGGGGGGGGDYGGYQPPNYGSLPALNYPSFQAPQFNAPSAFSYDPFAYESFQAPSIAEAQAEPGFEYALGQGVKAYENSKAYLGTYKSGSTIKGLNDYARNMANQNYNQVFERKGQTYDRNRGNAFQNYTANRTNAADAYATNYGISRDVFDRNYQGAKDEYAPRAREAELNFGRQWDQYAYEGDDSYRRWKAMIDANS